MTTVSSFRSHVQSTRQLGIFRPFALRLLCARVARSVKAQAIAATHAPLPRSRIFSRTGIK